MLKIVADAFGPPEAITMTEQRLGICFLKASDVRSRGSVVVKPLTRRTLTRKIGLFVRADNRHPALRPFVDLVLEKTAAWKSGR